MSPMSWFEVFTTKSLHVDYRLLVCQRAVKVVYEDTLAIVPLIISETRLRI